MESTVNRRNLLASAGILATSAVATRYGFAQMSSMPGMQHGGAVPPKAVIQPIEGQPLPMLKEVGADANGELVAELRASPASAEIVRGMKTPTLAYNGMSPGPCFVAREGDLVRITLVNEIPGQESTIHWHGMPVPAEQDGNPMNPVKSGGRQTYEFRLPEGSAGSYWYHPHPHKFTAEQVYRGLAGAFIVKPRGEDPVPAAFGDTPLFFTDLRLASDGTMPASTRVDLMNGRQGDFVLVNGAYKPELSLEAGTRRRFRLYNALNAGYLRISFGGIKFALISSDGGLLEAPVADMTEVLLAPAERAEVLVPFDGSQRSVTVQSLTYDRGWMGTGAPSAAAVNLMTISVTGSAAASIPPLPAKLRAIADLGASTITKRFVFGETIKMGGPEGMSMTFLINGKVFELGRIDETMKVGQPEIWEIVNPTDMDHPFHIHGTQFQVIDTEKAGKRVAAPFKAWKDTVNVASKETVRITIVQDMPGDRMYHCHILEHEHLGMMGTLRAGA